MISLLRLFGWKIEGKENVLHRSIFIVAPHTSMWDGFYGLLGLWEIGDSFCILAASWLFKGPGKLVMIKLLHAIPVGSGVSSVKKIIQVLRDREYNHIVICPEGTRSPIKKWGKSFIYISEKTRLRVNPVVLDYRSKKIIILESIDPRTSVIRRIYEPYVGSGKYPEKFNLPENI